MAKNYYFILNVATNASAEEIKSAYRRRVKELHPDYFGEDSAPFRELQEAYSVLGDPQKRRDYDLEFFAERIPVEIRRGYRKGRDIVEPFQPSAQRTAFQEVFLRSSFDTYSTSFDEIFDRLWRNFTGETPPKSERIESLTVDIPLSAEQAARGGQVKVMVPGRALCSTCGGRGGVMGLVCWRCGGAGEVAVEHPVWVSYPGGIVQSYSVSIPLNQFGIYNYFMTVNFRVSDMF